MKGLNRIGIEERDLLARLVSAKAPQLEGLVESLGEVPLTDEERELLRDVLADEFCEKGLHADDEPNAYGRLVDSLIGKLMFY